MHVPLSAALLLVSLTSILLPACTPKLKTLFLVPRSHVPQINSIAIVPIIAVRNAHKMFSSNEGLLELKDYLETLIAHELRNLGYSVMTSDELCEASRTSAQYSCYYPSWRSRPPGHPLPAALRQRGTDAILVPELLTEAMLMRFCCVDQRIEYHGAQVTPVYHFPRMAQPVPIPPSRGLYLLMTLEDTHHGQAFWMSQINVSGLHLKDGNESLRRALKSLREQERY